MAALPLQYPDLAIYLADETNIPIISSVGLGLYGEGDDEDEDEDDEDDEGEDEYGGTSQAASNGTHKPPSRRQRAAALDALTTTAFRARDAAARLGLGLDCLEPDSGTSSTTTDDAMAAWGMTPPEHVVVTYNTGAVLIESFMDPLQQQRLQRIQRQQQAQQLRQLQQLQHLQQHRGLRSELAIRSAVSPTDLSSDGGSPYHSPQGHSQRIDGYGASSGGMLGMQDYVEEDDDAAFGGPLLVGLVVAPGEQSVRDARRATTRLQRIGLAVQQDWAAEGSG